MQGKLNKYVTEFKFILLDLGQAKLRDDLLRQEIVTLLWKASRGDGGLVS